MSRKTTEQLVTWGCFLLIAVGLMGSIMNAIQGKPMSAREAEVPVQLMQGDLHGRQGAGNAERPE